MLHAYADCSYDGTRDVLGVGYVTYELNNNEKEPIETGNRVLDTNADSRGINWCSSRGELWALIVTARAALPYSNQPIVFHTDSSNAVEELLDSGRFEEYFTHAFYSFAGRYDNYYVQEISREQNEVADEQASLALTIGRNIKKNHNR